MYNTQKNSHLILLRVAMSYAIFSRFAGLLAIADDLARKKIVLNQTDVRQLRVMA